MNRQGTGIGQTLRIERERRRISLETISRATMIRRDYLERIDADELDRLPSGAYAKGFIRAYAGYLGFDPSPFVKAYESRCEAPAPELSSVVRQPVRVPHAAHPRTWRMAAGAAIATLLVLGFLGVVRSNDEPARPPQTTEAEIAALNSGPINADRVAATPTPNPAGATVRVEVTGSQAWVQAEEDGIVVFQGTLKRGMKRTFQAKDNVYLLLGTPRSVRIVANGRDMGELGGTVYRGTFTPQTTSLPPSQAR